MSIEHPSDATDFQSAVIDEYIFLRKLRINFRIIHLLDSFQPTTTNSNTPILQKRIL